MKRAVFLASCVLPFALVALPAYAQDLQTPSVAPPPPSAKPTADDQQVQFNAANLEYDDKADIVTATGDVRMFRAGNRLRADTVVWNRKTGKVHASGNVAVVNPGGDTAYGDSIDLTDALKDGIVDNMLLVLEKGGRLAARKGTRQLDETVILEEAAYTPCPVVDAANCPKSPSWKITAVQVIYRPDAQRIYYKGAKLHLFGLPALPLPAFSNPVAGDNDSGLLTPQFRYGKVNGFELAQPYHFALANNRGLTITPTLFTQVLPMAEVQYDALTTLGAYRITGYATASPRSDDINVPPPPGTPDSFRGYLDGIAHFQLSPKWSLSGSLRLTTDPTFLRRYDISSDDRLRTTVDLERIDKDSYLSIAGWYVQTLRLGDRQGLQPIALPEIDYRKRVPDSLFGGVLTFQVNTLGIERPAGQDTQRAFVSAQWELRKITPLGQEVTFTALGRADVYNASDTLATTVASYRGTEGISGRAIGAVAVDMKWPFAGSFLGGTQRLTPQVQFVAAPQIGTMTVPNEDSRSVDLEDTNLFAINRFPGYDRFEDSARVTYGLEWAVDLPGFSFTTNVGQSYRLSSRPSLFPDGTGLSQRVSDIVGRTELRFHDFISITHRYRLDQGGLAVRRNELDATIGSRSTYFLIGYIRLNRNIDPTLEDLQDREEIRAGARVQISKFWSIFGSTVIDLTSKEDDPLSLSDGFDPVRHRAGVQYEDDCLRLGLSWKRDYQDTGDARAGDSFLLTLAFKNLGR